MPEKVVRHLSYKSCRSVNGVIVKYNQGKKRVFYKTVSMVLVYIALDKSCQGIFLLQMVHQLRHICYHRGNRSSGLNHRVFCSSLGRLSPRSLFTSYLNKFTEKDQSPKSTPTIYFQFVPPET